MKMAWIFNCVCTKMWCCAAAIATLVLCCWFVFGVCYLSLDFGMTWYLNIEDYHTYQLLNFLHYWREFFLYCNNTMRFHLIYNHLFHPLHPWKVDGWIWMMVKAGDGLIGRSGWIRVTLHPPRIRPIYIPASHIYY